MADLNAFFNIKKESGKKYPVGKYLVACFLYYHCDYSIMSDEEFDSICNLLYDNFDDIKHPHKHLLDKEALKAGSGYQLHLSQYPTIVKSISYCCIEYDRMGKNYFEFTATQNSANIA
jgi:hypothetical protein